MDDDGQVRGSALDPFYSKHTTLKYFKASTDLFVLCVMKNAGQCSMGSTSAQGQDQTTWGELHGRENLRMKKPSLLFP